ncbi:hypothetical protein AMTR_s00060p00123780 [Amborella trichopoda]|uniref:Uncharacterized protein n=1 Tax=Amborella trichopoda TaxID=13333 RepID=W1NK17_AMBTC|nr:hypothetical protein AMTR_s00060p00123780 [Amborella trichopoda]
MVASKSPHHVHNTERSVPPLSDPLTHLVGCKATCISPLHCAHMSVPMTNLGYGGKCRCRKPVDPHHTSTHQTSTPTLRSGVSEPGSVSVHHHVLSLLEVPTLRVARLCYWSLHCKGLKRLLRCWIPAGPKSEECSKRYVDA